MGSVSLGILRGYSDSTSNEYGNFNTYLYYDSITRANNGNSTTVTFTNCYVKAVPVFSNKRYTSNTIYIDSVSIGSTSLGISSSWVGRKYAGVSNGKKVYLPQGHSTSKVTKNLTIAIGTGSLTVTLYGHRSGTETKSQKLTGTINFASGWEQLELPCANVVKGGQPRVYGDNGDNSATIILTDGSWGQFDDATGNSFKSCGLKYSTDGKNYTSLTSDLRTPLWKIYVPYGTTKISFKDIYISGSAQSSKAGKASNPTDVKHYSKPDKPSITKIQTSTSDDQMTVTVTATKGSNGSNNNATGVEIAHSVGDSAKSYKLGNTYTFTINSGDYDKTVIYARTVGTHNIDVYKNNDLKETTNIYYSDEIISFLDENVTITAPEPPNGLKIHDSGQNQFSITCSKGTDGTNNNAQDVEIYYTIDGTSPLDGGDKLRNSEDVHLYRQGEFVGVSKDTTVNAVARTVGFHPKYQYSTWTNIVSQAVLYYQAPTIQRPTISYDKKLTKKSTITINQSITIYKNSIISSCKAGLYKEQNHNNLQLDDISTINLTDLNNILKTKSVELQISHQFYLSQFDDICKGDAIYTKIIYGIQNGASKDLLDINQILASEIYFIESNGIMRVNVNNNWYEGQVWVNCDGVWKEATDVFVNHNTQWKESI